MCDELPEWDEQLHVHRSDSGSKYRYISEILKIVVKSV